MLLLEWIINWTFKIILVTQSEFNFKFKIYLDLVKSKMKIISVVICNLTSKMDSNYPCWSALGWIRAIHYFPISLVCMDNCYPSLGPNTCKLRGKMDSNYPCWSLSTMDKSYPMSISLGLSMHALVKHG